MKVIEHGHRKLILPIKPWLFSCYVPYLCYFPSSYLSLPEGSGLVIHVKTHRKNPLGASEWTRRGGEWLANGSILERLRSFWGQWLVKGLKPWFRNANFF